MIIKQKRYFRWLKNNLEKFANTHQAKIFLFGSSVKKDFFADIDVGVIGNVSRKNIIQLKEQFEESTFPYQVDIINFNHVKNSFKKNIFNNKILWIKH